MEKLSLKEIGRQAGLTDMRTIKAHIKRLMELGLISERELKIVLNKEALRSLGVK